MGSIGKEMELGVRVNNSHHNEVRKQFCILTSICFCLTSSILLNLQTLVFASSSENTEDGMIVVTTLDIRMDRMDHLVKARTTIMEIRQVEIRHTMMVSSTDACQLKVILETFVNLQRTHKF